MAVQPTIPGAAGGAVTGQKNLGIPVLGNMGGLNQNSPGGGNIVGKPVSGLPGATAVSTGQPPNPTQAPYMTPTSPLTNPLAQPTAGATPTVPVIAPISSTGAPANNGNTAANANPQQQQQLQKQLVDIYGKGTGNALANLIGNLGSNDSSYLQAYKDAMAKTESEGLSTIGTSLGNAGISADSSTSAIEKADYMSGLSSQVGLQEQQLIQSQIQTQAGLLQGVQSDSRDEVGTSWLDTFGQVAGIVGNVAGDVIGAGGFGAAAKTVPNILSGSARQIPGASTAPSMPSSIPYQVNLPGLDF